MTNQITVGNLQIEVLRKDIKNLHLSVHPPHGRVRVATPIKISDESVRLYVISKIPWIRKQQEQFEQQDRQVVRQFVARESHYLGGERHLLRLNYHNGSPRVELRNKGYIDMFMKEESTIEQRHRAMQNFYREQLKIQIIPLIEKWEQKLEVLLNEWGIKQMKTKWGTCNIEAKRIWLNLELAKKPLDCVEYIIVHELIHLKERHHNKNFVAHLDKFLPNWRSRKQLLNEIILGYVEW
jgi:predicted metal-dependent hydrolase